jgi:hypothetical protein
VCSSLIAGKNAKMYIVHHRWLSAIDFAVKNFFLELLKRVTERTADFQ